MKLFCGEYLFRKNITYKSHKIYLKTIVCLEIVLSSKETVEFCNEIIYFFLFGFKNNTSSMSKENSKFQFYSTYFVFIIWLCNPLVPEQNNLIHTRGALTISAPIRSTAQHVYCFIPNIKCKNTRFNWYFSAFCNGINQYWNSNSGEKYNSNVYVLGSRNSINIELKNKNIVILDSSQPTLQNGEQKSYNWHESKLAVE